MPVTTIDEVGSLRAKCEVIKTKADYQVERCEKTAKAFEDFEKLIKHLEGWQTEMDKNMKTTLENIEQGDPQTWEGELGKLKVILILINGFDCRTLFTPQCISDSESRNSDQASGSCQSQKCIR